MRASHWVKLVRLALGARLQAMRRGLTCKALKPEGSNMHICYSMTLSRFVYLFLYILCTFRDKVGESRQHRGEREERGHQTWGEREYSDILRIGANLVLCLSLFFSFLSYLFLENIRILEY